MWGFLHFTQHYLKSIPVALLSLNGYIKKKSCRWGSNTHALRCVTWAWPTDARRSATPEIPPREDCYRKRLKKTFTPWNTTAADDPACSARTEAKRQTGGKAKDMDPPCMCLHNDPSQTDSLNLYLPSTVKLFLSSLKRGLIMLLWNSYRRKTFSHVNPGDQHRSSSSLWNTNVKTCGARRQVRHTHFSVITPAGR